jgi:hypothetical protein
MIKSRLKPKNKKLPKLSWEQHSELLCYMDTCAHIASKTLTTEEAICYYLLLKYSKEY